MLRIASLSAVVFIFCGSAQAASVEDISTDCLISSYTQQPSSELRLELFRRGTSNPLVEKLRRVDSCINERGTFHLGEFAKPLSKETFEAMSTPVAVKAINLRILEYVRSNSVEEAWLFNALEILGKCGDEESEKSIAQLAYTTFDVRLASAAIKTLNKMTNGELKASTFDEWWSSEGPKLFSAKEIADLKLFKRRNSIFWTDLPPTNHIARMFVVDVDKLQDEDPNVRVDGCQMLAQLRRREAVPFLIELLDPKHAEESFVRQAAYDALVKLTNQRLAQENYRDWTQWWENAPEIERHGVSEMHENDPATDDVIGEPMPIEDSEACVTRLSSLLMSKNYRNRVRAAVGLRIIGRKASSAIPVLVVALADEDSSVRKWAARALMEIGPHAKVFNPKLEYKGLSKTIEDKSDDAALAAAEALLKLSKEDNAAKMFLVDGMRARIDLKFIAQSSDVAELRTIALGAGLNFDDAWLKEVVHFEFDPRACENIERK